MDECGPSLAGNMPPVTNDIDVGAELKAGRINVGLSEADVAQELRIEVEQVIGLEVNEYKGLSSAVFVKGYVRNYARLVGIDPAPLIAAIEGGGVQSPALKSLGTSLHSSGGRHGKGTQLPLGGIVTGVVAVLGLGLLGFIGERMYHLATESSTGTEISLPTARSTNGLGTSPIVSAISEKAENLEKVVAKTDELVENTVAIEKSVALQPAKEAPQTIQKPPKVEMPVVQTPVASEPVEVMEVVSEVASPAASPTPPNDSIATVTLHFASDSWAEVYSANKERLVSRIGKAGSSATVEGVPPFSLVLGFAPGVRVEYNGETVDVKSRTRGNVARMLVGKADLN